MSALCNAESSSGIGSGFAVFLTAFIRGYECNDPSIQESQILTILKAKNSWILGSVNPRFKNLCRSYYVLIHLTQNVRLQEPWDARIQNLLMQGCKKSTKSTIQVFKKSRIRKFKNHKIKGSKSPSIKNIKHESRHQEFKNPKIESSNVLNIQD